MPSTDVSTHGPAASDKIEPYVWKIAGVVILGMIMSILDTTIVNVALRTLSIDLHSSISQIQWVVTGYLLSLAAVIPVTGWAARRFGAKRVYMTSLVLFTAGSALCAVAASTTSLVLFRVLQGAGGGMIMPVGQLIMAQVAGPKRMGRVMGIVTMPAMLAPILGPVVGGAILQNLHWSWIFLVNLPVGVLAFVLAWRMLPQTDSGEAGRLDVVGLGLLSTGTTALVYGLSELGTHASFTAPTVIWPTLAGIVLIGVFILHALRVERPLLDVRLYSNRVFGAASLTTFGLGAALFGAMILVPLYYQEVRHESVIVTGLLVGPQGLGMLLVMPLVSRFTQRFGGGRVAIGGVLILSLASIPLAFVGDSTSIPFISVVLLLRGVGIGFSFMPAMTAAFAALRPSQLSDATPQLNVVQRVGGAIGTAVLAVVLQRATGHAVSKPASAFQDAYWWSVGICVLSLIPCLVLLRAENPRARLTRDAANAEAAVEPLGA
ncbi:MAG TPA: DHA2 family efflux MFS transporter permease subunit [Solirubrobacteraceae bacterium]|jgi:EmrB/QacA subfamily drug resistance transporter|nr:DHA2 family efflux MFS transporter permease subunit [Solirubrobacteraceae bacterium]